MISGRPLRLIKWFYPGLGIKRWLIVIIIGALLLVNGLNRSLIAEGLHFHVNEVLDNIVDDFMPPSYLSWFFSFAGLGLVALGMRQWFRSIIEASTIGGSARIVDSLFEMRLQNGFKIVAIGGGTGLSTLLRGLKKYTTNLTAVVTVSDDGGSSGRLQKELGVLPPGDIRNCLVALADDEALVTDLFKYRFSEGNGLVGHSFGNLFLAAMTGITGNFDKAVKESSRVLNIKGRVLPSTLGVVQLCATLDDGTTIEGESNISASHGRNERVYFNPPYAAPLGEVIEAIREADAIVLGPGSLFTSILPNFLVDRVAAEVEKSSAVKMYICNVMTQPGETDSLTASEHAEALIKNAGKKVFDYVIINEEAPSKLLEVYAEEGQVPVMPDAEKIKALGAVPVSAKVISETVTVRHDPAKLAGVVISIIERAIAH
ncbi:MAG: YvcK family protein, partial [Candidatus Eremiobacteraeota bacterium]|nr:YvcK family protein [Candidatus Eremiobacteraeota bacterium]